MSRVINSKAEGEKLKKGELAKIVKAYPFKTKL